MKKKPKAKKKLKVTRFPVQCIGKVDLFYARKDPIINMVVGSLWHDHSEIAVFTISEAEKFRDQLDDLIRKLKK